jgi:hypothetical protein
MKCYAELACDNVEVVSKKIYSFLQMHTTLISKPIYGWNFIDCRQLLSHVPELLEFFKKNKLIPRHAAVTIITNNDHLSLHTDEPPVIAKVNFPVSNTIGWANRWYVDDQLVAEVINMNKPMVFNSQVAHSVEIIDAAQLPRIIASFTFFNEPLHLLCE